MDVRVAYTYINKCIWCNGSGPCGHWGLVTDSRTLYTGQPCDLGEEVEEEDDNDDGGDAEQAGPEQAGWLAVRDELPAAELPFV